MKDLSNYIPDEIKFNLPKAADRFPKVLFEGADSLAEIEKLLADKFVALNAGPKVVRFLDAYEKQTMRNNYAELMEGDKIKHETELVKIEAEAKQRVKDAKERLQATLTRIDNLVKEVKAGKIDFKVDKFGIVHTSIGKVSFSPEQIVDNANEFLSMIMKLKPSAAKGSYVKSIYLSSTMSPGLQIDAKSVETK